MSIFDEIEQEGIEKGKKEGMKMVIHVLKRWLKGIEPQTIASILDLPIEQVEEIIPKFESES